MGYMGSGGTDGAGPSGWANHYLRGVMGANLAERIEDIHDGSSNTILIGEVAPESLRKTPGASGR